MTVDRDQIRRDAEERQFVCQCAKDCLALLAELEQAEKKLDNAKFERDMHASAIDRLETSLYGTNGYRGVDDLEARLAKVSALVEAGHKLNESCDDSDASDRWSEVVAEWDGQ